MNESLRLREKKPIFIDVNFNGKRAKFRISKISIIEESENGCHIYFDGSDKAKFVEDSYSEVLEKINEAYKAALNFGEPI